MASKPTLMNALFDQFTSFIVELTEMYPDDADFPLFLTSIKLLKATNPSLVAKYIFENTIGFEEKIMKKEESFFLQYAFSEYSQDVDLNIFSKLKQYFEKMTPSTKENIWKYIQNIFRLSKAISSM